MNGKNYIRRFSNRIKGSKAYRSTRKIIKDHGADIFSVLAGIGVITTGISAYNAGKNASNESDFKYVESKLDKRYLLRPILFGTGTIGCIGAARYFGLKKEESLLAACSVLSLYSQRKRVTPEVCEPVGGSGYFDSSDIEDTGTGDVTFIEDFTGRKFKSNMQNVLYSIERLQELFSIGNCATLNDFYELLGIHTTTAGDVLGWSVNQTVLDPYLNEEDYDEMINALVDLRITIKYWEGIGYVIHYPVMPIGGLAGCGPCNY